MLSKQTAQLFKEKHKLDDAYLIKASKYYEPMVDHFIEKKSQTNTPLIIGVNGCQGSGKSTISDYMATCIEDKTEFKTVVFSLDDFYLSKEKREELSENIHPLLATRGVPGTHNTTLLQYVVDQLNYQQPVYIPRFNKAKDDVEPNENWTKIEDPVDFIIIEGWCLGVSAQDDQALKASVNDLEKNEDENSVWRIFVNDNIKNNYQPIYDLIENWVVLKAPSFDLVYQWRKEQEDKLKDKLKDATEKEKSNIMSDAQIKRFIEFFERLTVHGFNTLPDMADFCFEFDSNRDIAGFKTKVDESVV